MFKKNKSQKGNVHLLNRRSRRWILIGILMRIHDQLYIVVTVSKISILLFFNGSFGDENGCHGSVKKTANGSKVVGLDAKNLLRSQICFRITNHKL